MEKLSTRDLRTIDERLNQVLKIVDSYSDIHKAVRNLKDDIYYGGIYIHEILKLGYTIRYMLEEFYLRSPKLKNGSVIFEEIVFSGIEEFVQATKR